MPDPDFERRWDRIAGCLLSASLAVALLAGAAGAGSSHRVAARIHVVRSGETLWSIARGVVGPHGDPRPVVDRLVLINHVESGTIRPGERLLLPTA